MSTRTALLTSNICKQEQLESEMFRVWCERLRIPYQLQRKQWEFCYIAQALEERGRLVPGCRGLGFGVGQEPLVAFFASRGCQIVATDLEPERAQAAGWVDTGQHAANLEGLNGRQLCPPAKFRERVSFRSVDMNDIPDDLRDFNFTWSSCVFEHLGSIENGMRFIERQMDCLRPGGVAVHTTEFNVTSNEETLDNNDVTVLFRRQDIEELGRRLRARNHEIDLDFTLGDRVADNFVDVPPYFHNEFDYHIRIQLDRFVTTSIGLIIHKSRQGLSRWRLRRAMQRVLGRHGSCSKIS